MEGAVIVRIIIKQAIIIKNLVDLSIFKRGFYHFNLYKLSTRKIRIMQSNRVLF